MSHDTMNTPEIPARADQPIHSDDAALSLNGIIPPIRRSPLYLLSLLFVAVAMLLLPLLYLALITGVGYLTYYYAIHWEWLLGGTNSRALQWRLLAYLGPLAAGGILLLFMVKPLFARRCRGPAGFALQPEVEPRLFAHVQQLSRIVHAPAPREIHVDCDVNACASFRRGLLSFLGRDLRLTIGLPLVAGLSLRELTGVLAHELGHFSQGWGMRLTYVIRMVNDWFARVVYQRDAWDAKLVEASETKNPRISLIALLTRALVWLTRRILWLLMIVGHGISSFMLRRMEYDADRYEVHVAGSAAFADTSRKLRQLGLGDRAAHAELSEAWRERRLADDLPALMVSKLNALPPELAREFEARIAQQRTGLFASHPSDADRLRAASRAASAGIACADAPARVLFSDFATLCRTVSLRYYRDALGDQIQPSNLISTQQLLVQRARVQRESQAIERFFGLALSPARPFRIARPEFPPGTDPREVLETLRAARREVTALLSAAKESYAHYDEAFKTLVHIAAADVLASAKIAFDAADYNLPNDTPEAVAAKRRESLAQQNQALLTIRTFETVARRRLLAAIQLLLVPAVAKRTAHADQLAPEAAQLLAVLENLDLALEGLPEMWLNLNALYAAGTALQRAEESASLQAVLRTRMAALVECVSGRRAELMNVVYPFSHASGRVSVGQYLIDTPPTDRGPQAVFEGASTFADNLSALHLRVVGRLAVIALHVETALQPRPEKPSRPTAGPK